MKNPCNDEFFQLAARMLKVDEDERQFAYDDKTGATVRKLPSGGNLTIGIGRNLAGKGLRPDEIQYLLRNDVNEALGAANEIFPDFGLYERNRQLGIVNLIFNLGEGDDASGFREFKDTISAIRARNWGTAARCLERSLWYRQVKSRGPRVVSMIEGNIYAY